MAGSHPGLHLRPVQFADSPVGRDGEVARIAGGMQWFAAYEVIEGDRRRTLSIAEFDRTLGADDERAATLHAAITAPRAPLTLGQRTLRFDQPQVMGILNVTPDSFSDGGADRDAVAAGVAMAADGAALVDVGGESTRPGAQPVWEEDERQRVEPVICGLATAGVLVSADTRKAPVMEAALVAGAGIVNDVALTTRELGRMIERAGIDFVNLPDEVFDEPLGISTGAGVIFGATGGVMEAALLDGEGHALHAGLLQCVHGFHHGLVGYGFFCADEDGRVSGLAGLPGFRGTAQLLQAHGAFVAIGLEFQAAVLVDNHLPKRLGWLAAFAHRGNVDGAGRQHGRSHHENDQQHQHHIDEGHHVDFVHGAAAAAGARGHCGHGGLPLQWPEGEPGWVPRLRCRMLENSSMKVSWWLATRSMSRAKRL